MMRTMARRIAVRLSLLIALAAVAAPSLAQTAGKPLKDALVGHWRLVSVKIGDAEPYGAGPQGSMFLDAGGQYSVVVVTGGGARSISYFGAYSVDEAAGSMTMHIDASSRAGAAGRDEKRHVTLNGDELVVESANPARAPGGVIQTWKRAE